MHLADPNFLPIPTVIPSPNTVPFRRANISYFSPSKSRDTSGWLALQLCWPFHISFRVIHTSVRNTRNKLHARKDLRLKQRRRHECEVFWNGRSSIVRWSFDWNETSRFIWFSLNGKSCNFYSMDCSNCMGLLYIEWEDCVALLSFPPVGQCHSSMIFLVNRNYLNK